VDGPIRIFPDRHATQGFPAAAIGIVADDTSERPLENWLFELGGPAMLAADVSATLGTIAAFAFVLFVLGVVVYALVRPFTHFDHKHEDNLWVHLD
jgi:hypothetical protein